jgi:hypothetical protein
LLIGVKSRKDLAKLSKLVKHDYSQGIEYEHTLKFRTQPHAAEQITVEYANARWEVGFQYCGKVPLLIYTEGTRLAQAALLSGFCTQAFAVLACASEAFHFVRARFWGSPSTSSPA